MSAAIAGGKSDQVLGFMDILFGAGFAVHFSVLITRPWFSNPFGRLSEYWEEAFLVLAIYVWMILSWWVSRRSLTSVPSTFPLFVTDVAILMLYFVILTSFETLGGELQLFSIAFGLFILWDYFRANAMHTNYGRPRDRVTWFWSVVFFVMAISYNLGLRPDAAFLVLLVATTILFRLHKNHPWLVAAT